MTTFADTPLPSAARSAGWPRSGWLATPGYDAVFFIGGPPLALLLSAALGFATWPFERTELVGSVDMRVAFFLGFWNASHLAAVVFRSHANPEIFRRHRVRFVLVPPLLLALLLTSHWLLVAGFALAAFWDIYHTTMQTFGLARIYDARRGNPPEVGRRLDLILSHFIYVGPLVAGPALGGTLEDLQRFSALGWEGPARMLESVEAWRSVLAAVVIASGISFGLFYVKSYARLRREGYRVSPQKIALLTSTGVTTILAWGFLPPLQAFFLVTFFHALQYFGIVWWTEKANLSRLLGLGRAGGRGRSLTLGAFVLALALAGWACLAGEYSDLRLALASVLVLSLMHFWYDGFIWSVRRGQVG